MGRRDVVDFFMHGAVAEWWLVVLQRVLVLFMNVFSTMQF